MYCAFLDHKKGNSFVLYRRIPNKWNEAEKYVFQLESKLISKIKAKNKNIDNNFKAFSFNIK